MERVLIQRQCLNEVLNDRKRAAVNSIFAIGRVSFSVDSLVVAESVVLRMNTSAENPAHQKYAKHQAVKKNPFSMS